MEFSVYYHIWSPGNTDIWKIIVDEQLKRIYKSGLPEYANINCAINGVQASRIKEFVSIYDWLNVLDCRDSDEEYEGFTLKHLYEDCVNEKTSKVLYLHTKGISHFCGVRDQYSDRKFRAVNSWRHLMEAGCIDNWVKNVEKLNKYQVSGVNYCLDPWPHMSGNFWWARSDYISTLQHPTKDAFRKDSRDFGPVERMNFEKWVGMNNPVVYSFYNPPFSYDFKDLIPDVRPTPPGEPHWFWLYRDDIFPHYIEKL
jgi:hypothetical protein